MNKNISSTIFFLVLIFFFSYSYPQVIKKNGIFFRDHKLNPDFVLIKNNKTASQKSSSYVEINADPIEPPFVKQDFMVNTFDGDYGADQSGVSAAIDGSGNYAFAWLDYQQRLKRNICTIL